jgi:hypothetical protein
MKTEPSPHSQEGEVQKSLLRDHDHPLGGLSDSAPYECVYIYNIIRIIIHTIKLYIYN